MSSDPSLWRSFQEPEDTFRAAMDKPSLEDVAYGLYQLTRAFKSGSVLAGQGPTAGADEATLRKAFQFPEDDFKACLKDPDLSDIVYGLYRLTRAFKQVGSASGGVPGATRVLQKAS